MYAQESPRESSGFRASVASFFYSKEVPYGLALVRFFLPLTLLFVVVPRWSFARELYSTDGAAAPLALSYGFINFLPEPSGTVAVAAMSMLTLSLICSSIGWFTRTSLTISFCLYTYINLLDSLSTITKYSAISSHLLLILALSRCGTVWSIDSWRAGSKRPSAFHVWPRRLMQLLIGLIYLGAAMTKLHTNAYFSSDQLRHWLMTNLNHHNPAGELLSFYPEIIIVMANIAILWQLVFVFVVWRPHARFLILGMGIGFHLSTTPTLGLYIFPCVMISSYLGFLSERDVRLFVVSLKRLFRKSRHCFAQSQQSMTHGASPGRLAWAGSFYAWAAILFGSAVVGVAAEHSLDPYKLRGTDGPLPLKPADPQLVARLDDPFVRITEEDLILSLDTSRTTLGGVLLDLEEHFQRDESFAVQVGLVPPHPDMWLECNLLDAEGRTIHRAGQVVPREQLRASWNYRIPLSQPAGIYSLELRSVEGVLATRPVFISE